jgi:hypothetical protein
MFMSIKPTETKSMNINTAIHIIVRNLGNKLIGRNFDQSKRNVTIYMYVIM